MSTGPAGDPVALGSNGSYPRSGGRRLAVPAATGPTFSMRPIFLVLLALCVAAIPTFWMWRRMREERRTSLDDHVRRAKAHARTELNRYLSEERSKDG